MRCIITRSIFHDVHSPVYSHRVPKLLMFTYFHYVHSTRIPLDHIRSPLNLPQKKKTHDEYPSPTHWTWGISTRNHRDPLEIHWRSPKLRRPCPWICTSFGSSRSCTSHLFVVCGKRSSKEAPKERIELTKFDLVIVYNMSFSDFNIKGHVYNTIYKLYDVPKWVECPSWRISKGSLTENAWFEFQFGLTTETLLWSCSSEFVRCPWCKWFSAAKKSDWTIYIP